jgi:hypothetical protein
MQQETLGQDDPAQRRVDHQGDAKQDDKPSHVRPTRFQLQGNRLASPVYQLRDVYVFKLQGGHSCPSLL